RAGAFGVEISLAREVPELMEHDEPDAAQVGVVVRPDDQRALIQGGGDAHEKILHPSPGVAIEPETVICPRIEPVLRTEDGQVELESGAELALEVCCRLFGERRELLGMCPVSRSEIHGDAPNRRGVEVERFDARERRDPLSMCSRDGYRSSEHEAECDRADGSRAHATPRGGGVPFIHSAPSWWAAVLLVGSKPARSCEHPRGRRDSWRTLGSVANHCDDSPANISGQGRRTGRSAVGHGQRSARHRWEGAYRRTETVHGSG